MPRLAERGGEGWGGLRLAPSGVCVGRGSRGVDSDSGWSGIGNRSELAVAVLRFE